MKPLLILFTLFTIHAQAQYFPEEDIRIIDTGYAPMGAEFIKQTKILESYFSHTSNETDLILSLTSEAKGNVARIVTTEYRKRKKLRVSTMLEIWRAASAENTKIVPDKQFCDSLRSTLIDTNKESMIVLYSAYTKYAATSMPSYIMFQPEIARNVEGCSMSVASVCSYTTEEEIPIFIKYRGKKGYTVDMKPGVVIFVAFVNKSQYSSFFVPVDFYRGYSTCRLYQKINDRIRNR